MTQKRVEAELKRLLELEADHLDCLQTGETGYPISTAHLLTSAVMPLKSITESLEREVNQDFFSSNNIIIPKRKKIKKRSFNNYSLTKVKARNFLTNILQRQTSFKQNAKVIQYVYVNLFPRYFCRIDDYGIGVN